MTSYHKFARLLSILIVLEILDMIQTQLLDNLNSWSFNRLYRHTDEPAINVVKLGENNSVMNLQIPISLYSKRYSKIYINKNGILTFDKEFPEFLYPGKNPSIAPFFVNVDTSVPSRSTIISLFKSQNREKLHMANSLVRRKYSNNFEATILYVATWENVGYYAGQTDQLNTFQAVMICNWDETYVQFIYPEKGINWLQANSGVIGVLNVPAQAGFVSDDGRNFMINGSGTKNARNFSKTSNIGINGVFLYRIGLLDFESNISDDDSRRIMNDNISPMSCAAAGVTCHSSAACIDKTNGFYCQCFEGYYGNGLSCIRNTKTISVSGMLSGKINNRTIDETANILSIIDMREGVSTTAIRNISDILETQLKLAVPVFSSFGWLLAKPLSPEFMNGYQWTGGKFVHSSQLIFESSEILHVNQTFEVNNLKQTVKIDINGFVPKIDFDERIEIPGYTIELKFSSRNTISTTVKHYVEIPSKNKVIAFQLSQNISYKSYNSCYKYDIDPDERTSLEKVSRTSLNYNRNEYILSSTKMVTRIGDDATLDPCKSGLANCPIYSTCVPDEDAYKCVCAIGWEENVTEDGVECVDIDECQNELSLCRDDGYCVNVMGGYECFCKDPNESDCVRKFEDDGFSYATDNMENDSEISFELLPVDRKVDCFYKPELCCNHSSCIRSESKPELFECICDPGFYSSDGSGNFCEKENCHQTPSLCNTNADCNSINGSFTCVCKPGYHGNGTSCIKRGSVRLSGIQDVSCTRKKFMLLLLLLFEALCVNFYVFFYFLK